MYDMYVKEEIKRYKDSFKDKHKDIIDYAIKDGKCLRAFITKNIMYTLSGFSDWRVVTACEAIHASSLILDDLPCMDNDKLRRNKDSTFVKYGEQKSIITSILMTANTLKLLIQCVGDLKKKELLSDELEGNIYKSITLEWTHTINELINGQFMDLNMSEDDDIETLIKFKTCSLFSLSFVLGGLFSCIPVELKIYRQIGFHFGLMFQLIDDIDDIEDDKKNTNYISVKGYNNSLIKFNKEKEECVTLMKSVSIYSVEMEKCIIHLEQKWNSKIKQH